MSRQCARESSCDFFEVIPLAGALEEGEMELFYTFRIAVTRHDWS